MLKTSHIASALLLAASSLACSLGTAFLGDQENRGQQVPPTGPLEGQLALCPSPTCPTPVSPSAPTFEFFEDGDLHYALDYDPAIWQFVEATQYPPWPRIVHRGIPDCELLEFGATEPPPIPPAQERIGDYTWSVYGADDPSESLIWYITLDSRIKIALKLPTQHEDLHETCRLAGVSVLETLRPQE